MPPDAPLHDQYDQHDQHARGDTAVAVGAGQVLEAQHLVKRFGLRRAVDDVSLAMSAGECLAVFGPNGAGKTTLLRMLGGLLKPTKGAVHIADGSVHRSSRRRMVGLLSHHTLLYAALTARENVRFAAECHGVRDADDAARRALARLDVDDRAGTPVRLLSRGLQQRVSIARALVHDPRVLLLDEPYTGLDDVGARALTTALRELRANGAALILVTHHLEEGLTMATRAMVMLSGRVVHAENAGASSVIDRDAFTARYRMLVAGGAA